MTRMHRSLSLMAAFAVLLCPTAARAAINPGAGTSGAQFLKLGAGSRAGAMGEAYSAIADDVYGVYYNPAALTRLTESQIAAAHAEHFQGISYDFAAFAYPFGRETGHSRHVLAGSIYNLSIADIERRTADTRAPIGTFEAGDYAYTLSYAYRAMPNLSLGVSGKLIHETIDSYSASAYAADLAALYTIDDVFRGRPLWLSGVIKNLGTDISFAGVTDPLPRGLVVGAGTRLSKRTKLAVDVTKYRDTNAFIGAGVEYLHPFTQNVSGALRGGINTHRIDNEGMNLMSFGAGINFYRAGFDFAWVPYGDLGNTFRFSLVLRFANK
ncbi:MAG: PorV/PorQ family protein [Elusimicrobia bacterium]|nr:PorV/PorQ family protein [Elusimicrobiota bacterium]